MTRLLAGILCVMVAAWPAAAQITKLPHEPDREDFFGAAVSLSGNSAVVGASGEDSCGPYSGAAYVFDRAFNGVWNQATRIACGECRPGQFFGQDVAISGDVAVVAAGAEYFAAERTSAAHVFERTDGGTWREVAHLGPTQTDPGTFATSVDVDGDRILVVASGDRTQGTYSGAAYVFERSTEGRWEQAARIVPVVGSTARGDVFGSSGAIHGDRIIIGAPARPGTRLGSVYIFEYSPAAQSWLQRARLDGYSSADIAVDIHGDHAITGDHERGTGLGNARLYERNADGGWRLRQQLVPAVSSQSGGVGTRVAAGNGRALVVGFDEQLDQATNIDRVVFVFEPDDRGVWRQRHILDIGETAFGTDLEVDGGYAIIGSSGDQAPGAAFVVRIH